MAITNKVDDSGLPRRMLSAAGLIYGRIMTIRNSLYDHGVLKTRWLDAPVIAVGNMTTGGTGKTPMVIYLAKMVESIGERPGVIMRGYGSKPGKEADEVMLLRRHLPGVPIIGNPDRIDGGKHAIQQGAEVIIADDAYQHRRLGRDLDICLVDAMFPFGGGQILPLGRLREPMTGFSRADLVILTRCDQVTESKLAEIEAELRQWIGSAIPLLRSSHVPNYYVDFSGREFEVGMLKWKKVFAWAGIGRPEAFYETIRRLGVEIVGTRDFRDHYRVTVDDLRSLRTQAETCGAEMILCTEKDVVKINDAMVREAGVDCEKMAALKINIVMSSEHEHIFKTQVEKVTKEFSRKKLTNIR